jgi:hypothetical protein
LNAENAFGVGSAATANADKNIFFILFNGVKRLQNLFIALEPIIRALALEISF